MEILILFTILGFITWFLINALVVYGVMIDKIKISRLLFLMIANAFLLFISFGGCNI